MLTETQRLQNETKFKNIFLDFVTREGRDKLLEMLDRTDFFQAPASVRYHCNYDGGLCEHTLNVFIAMIEHAQTKSSLLGYECFPLFEKIKKCESLDDRAMSAVNLAIEAVYGPDVTLENVVVSALCHDFHKINFYEKYSKRCPPNEKNPQWHDEMVWGYNPDPFVLGDDGTNSAHIAESYMRLKYCEKAAIINHMGKDRNGFPLQGSGSVWKKSPLALHLHLCDMIATYEIEK